MDDPESEQITRGESRPYRMNRKLSPANLKEFCALYEAGASIVKLAQKLECHRHTVARQLEKARVQIRPQRKMTADLIAQAATLYTNDHTLEDIARLLGLEASTIGKALKRAGVTLRPPVADRWHGSPAE
jgi:transposase-like protein